MFLHQKPFAYMLGLALSDHRVQNMRGLAHKCGSTNVNALHKSLSHYRTHSKEGRLIN